MNIFDFLPKFNIIEPNNLKGLQPGFVVAQVEPAGVYDNDGKILATITNTLVNTTKVAGHYLVENGQLAILTGAGYDAFDGSAADAATCPLFVTYTEELLPFGNDYKYYAADVEHDPARLVQLIPGDEWTTTIDPTNAAYAAAITAGRIKVLTRNYISGNTTVANAHTYCFDDFLDCNRFADGQPSYTYVFLK